jgi:hypothetical protein
MAEQQCQVGGFHAGEDARGGGGLARGQEIEAAAEHELDARTRPGDVGLLQTERKAAGELGKHRRRERIHRSRRDGAVAAHGKFRGKNPGRADKRHAADQRDEQSDQRGGGHIDDRAPVLLGREGRLPSGEQGGTHDGQGVAPGHVQAQELGEKQGRLANRFGGKSRIEHHGGRDRLDLKAQVAAAVLVVLLEKERLGLRFFIRGLVAAKRHLGRGTPLVVAREVQKPGRDFTGLAGLGQGGEHLEVGLHLEPLAADCDEQFDAPGAEHPIESLAHPHRQVLGGLRLVHV